MSSLPLILAAVLDGGGGAYAQMLASLLPPGKLWRLRADSFVAKVLLASSSELERVDGRVTDMLEEADPTTADELLPEYERDFAIHAAATIEERRANIVARRVRRQRFRPADFKQALATLLVQDAADVVVRERSRAFVTSIGDAREIFRFFIYRNPALPGTAFIASAQTLVDEMKPSHTIGTVVESIAAVCDDPSSLCDRDLMGA